MYDLLSITHTTGASSEKVLYFANELFKMIQEIEYHSSSNDTQRLIQELKQEISLTPSLASEIKKELQNIYLFKLSEVANDISMGSRTNEVANLF